MAKAALTKEELKQLKADIKMQKIAIKEHDKLGKQLAKELAALEKKLPPAAPKV